MEEFGKTLTLTQLSKYLGIPKRTLFDMIKDERFGVPAIKGVYPRRWSKDAVDNWVKGDENV